MTIPSQPDIKLPLLLELERSGGRVRKGVRHKNCPYH
jgi:hypothetical protein